MFLPGHELLLKRAVDFTVRSLQCSGGHPTAVYKSVRHYDCYCHGNVYLTEQWRRSGWAETRGGDGTVRRRAMSIFPLRCTADPLGSYAPFDPPPPIKPCIPWCKILLRPA